jgi:hypothetical protein
MWGLQAADQASRVACELYPIDYHIEIKGVICSSRDITKGQKSQESGRESKNTKKYMYSGLGYGIQ